MWILLRKKLPTEISPPKLSIFWSQPWYEIDVVIRQFKEHIDVYEHPEIKEFLGLDARGEKLDPGKIEQKMLLFMMAQEDTFIDRHGGQDPNWAKARSIMYKGQKIRVHSYEYSVLSHKHMIDYVEHSHELIPDNVAEVNVVQSLLEGDLKEIYDAALVDGANHTQGLAMALGLDIQNIPSDELANFPPIGWYKCRREYAEIYCTEKEMEES